MAKLSKAKDVNTTSLHNGNQIAELIKYTSLVFTKDEISEESIKHLKLLISAFSYSQSKLHGLFGNNLAKTDFPRFSNMILSKYLQGNKDQLTRIVIPLCSSLIWNLTDSSESFCKELLNCENFSENIVKILQNTDFIEENRILVESSLSIINNIVRRESLRSSFDQFDIIDRIMKLQKSPLMSRDLRIICVAMIFYIIPKVKLKEVESLADDIRDDVVEILDAASNADNFQAEGFSMRELLEILTVICRDVTTKSRVGNNQTLSLTLLRLLGKNSHSQKIISLATAMYTEQQFSKFRQNYIDKFGETNEVVMNLLKTK